MGVSVDHGWRPVGKPMLVTRAEGTVVHELDGTPALDAYLAEQGDGLDPSDPDFFRKVMAQPGRVCPTPGGAMTSASCTPTSRRAAGSISTSGSRSRASSR